MKNILFPTDFSDSAASALRYAVALAVKFRAKIHLLHTYQVPYNRGDVFMSLMDVLQKDSEEGLRKTAQELKSDIISADVSCETISQVGELTDVVDNITAEKSIDLIVMGTKGASGLQKEFFGSNTGAVIQKSKCPVLAIPEGYPFFAPKKIGLAYDLDRVKNNDAFSFLSHVAKEYNSEIVLCSVAEEASEEIVDHAVAGVKMSNYFENIKVSFYLSENDHIIEGINTFIKEKEIDWLVMIARHHTLFERLFHKSLTKEIAYHLQVPLLALHD